MKTISLGETTYRLKADQREGRWVAHAEDTTGGRFGTECGGESEAEAISRLERWLTWQREHAAALEALQRAEGAYHRTIAGSAFASPTEGPSPLELQKESLDELESARIRLDEVRARKPEC